MSTEMIMAIKQDRALNLLEGWPWSRLFCQLSFADHGLGETKIADLKPSSLSVNKDVVGLDVSVNQAALVDVLQSSHQL